VLVSFLACWLFSDGPLMKVNISNSNKLPGVLFVSQAFTAFDEETYSATFGGVGVTMIEGKIGCRRIALTSCVVTFL
jgi:hypothetical protein